MGHPPSREYREDKRNMGDHKIFSRHLIESPDFYDVMVAPAWGVCVLCAFPTASNVSFCALITVCFVAVFAISGFGVDSVLSESELTLCIVLPGIMNGLLGLGLSVQKGALVG